MSFLSRDQVNLFKSDFKFVADYFVQVRETNNYVNSKIKAKHASEVLELLRVMTGDSRIVDSIVESDEKKTKNGGIKPHRYT